MLSINRIINLSFLLLFIFIAHTPLLHAGDDQPEHPNRAEAAKLDESGCADGFSFAVAGDIHQNFETMEEMISRAKAVGVDFAVAAGDFTNNGEPGEYEKYIERINESGLPWFSVPGNHEYRSPDGHTSLTGKKRYKRIFGSGDFMFTHCGWAFVGLDTAAFDAILPAQLNKLERVLRKFRGKTVVFSHYPPAIVPNWEDGIWRSNAASFMSLLEKYDTPYFIAGHIHVYDEYSRGPTTYVITGGGGGGVDSDRGPENLNSPLSGAFHHFVLVHANAEKMEYEIVRLSQEPGGSSEYQE